MNNLFEIISQSWQIARKNKLLWMFSFILSLLSVLSAISPQFAGIDNIRVMTSLCISPVWFFVWAFSMYGMIFCAGKAILDVDVSMKDVRNKFKADFWKLVGVGGCLLIVFLPGVTFLRLGVWELLPMATRNFISEATWSQIIAYLVGPIFGGILFISLLGVIFKLKGVFRSLKNGVKVFLENKKIFIFISYAGASVNFIIVLAVIVFLATTGRNVDYPTYANTIGTNIYFKMFQMLLSFVLLPLWYMSYLLVYFGKIPAQEK